MGSYYSHLFYCLIDNSSGDLALPPWSWLLLDTDNDLARPGLGCYGAGCIVLGRGNTRPGTTIADHWLHCASRTRYVVVVSAASCRPTLPLFVISDLTARSQSRTPSSNAPTHYLTDCLASVLAPTPYRPQGNNRYFPFCARPARVQGPHIVPLIHGASSLRTSYHISSTSTSVHLLPHKTSTQKLLVRCPLFLPHKQSTFSPPSP